MKEYTVVILTQNRNDDSETEQLVTRDLQKAIKEARYFRSRNAKVEIRAYTDPDHENTENWDYEAVDF